MIDPTQTSDFVEYTDESLFRKPVKVFDITADDDRSHHRNRGFKYKSCGGGTAKYPDRCF